MLLNDLINKITNSFSLYEKCINMQSFFSSYKEKNFADFLFELESSFDFRVKNGEVSLKLNENEDFVKNDYYNWVCKSLNKISEDKLCEVRIYEHLCINYEFEGTVYITHNVKFNSDSQETFELKSSPPPIVRLYKINNNCGHNITASFEGESFLISQEKDLSSAFKTLNKLNKIRDDISKIDLKIKEDLYSIFRTDLLLFSKSKSLMSKEEEEIEISSRKTNHKENNFSNLGKIFTKNLEFLEVCSIEPSELIEYPRCLDTARSIIDKWIDIKSPKDLTPFIKRNEYLGFFGRNETWIEPIVIWLNKDWTFSVE